MIPCRIPRHWVVPALIALAAFAVRIVPFLDELGATSIPFYQTDSYYFLRRAAGMLHDFPSIPRFDLYLSYPVRADFISPPFLPLFVASAGWIIDGGMPAPHTLELVQAVANASLGAACILPLWALGRSFLPAPFLACAAILYAIDPFHYWYSNGLAGDHHGIVAFIGLLSTVAFVKSVEDDRFRTAASGGMLLALVCLTWQGAVQYVVIDTAYCIFAAFRTRRGAPCRRGGMMLLMASAVTLPFVLISPPLQDPFNFGTFSFFNVAGCAAAGSMLLAVHAVMLGRRMPAIAWAVLGITAFAPVSGQFVGLAGLVSGSEHSFYTSAEVASFLDMGYWRGRLDASFLRRNILIFSVLLPFAVVPFAGRKARPTVAATAFYGAAFGVLTLMHRRCGYDHAPFMALSAAFFAAAAWRHRRHAVAAALIACPLWVHLDFVARCRDYNPPDYRNNLKAAFAWMRSGTAPPSPRPGAPEVMPDYSVLIPWDQAYHLAWMAQRAVAANGGLLDYNKQGFVDVMTLLSTGDKHRFNSLLETYRMKYIVITNDKARYPNPGIDEVPSQDGPVYGILQRYEGPPGGVVMDRFRLLARFPSRYPELGSCLVYAFDTGKGR